MKSEMLYTNTHVFFLYSNHVFSNFHPAKYIFQDIEFRCSEQGYMWEKAMRFKDYETAQLILESYSPYDMKMHGRNVKNFDQQEWDKVKHVCMMKHIIEKFRQNKDMEEVLLNTGKRIIVEASNKDLIWGCGIRIDDPKLLEYTSFPGQNLLGICLMALRNYLHNRPVFDFARENFSMSLMESD